MKIQLASDLHLEFLQKSFPGERLISPAHGADVLVLAGDIANGTQAIELFKDWPVPVLYIAGNHEFYSQSIEQMRIDLRRAAEGTAVRFLDNGVADFGGVRFLGCTLWTDYRLTSNRTQRQLMENAEMKLNDHHVIHTQEGRFTAAMALEEHEQSRRWLEHQLGKPYDGKTVVVSHHGPHRLSVHPRYIGDITNAAFVSQLDELLAKTDLWLHGHVHDTFDYVVEGCRVVANPLGYARNRHQAANRDELRFENPAFQWAYVIDLPPFETASWGKTA
jgi:predicted phosphodiesterase